MAGMLLGAAGFHITSPEAKSVAFENLAQRADDRDLSTLQDKLTTSLAYSKGYKSIGEFALVDTDDKSITQTVFDDKWSVIFFGFTNCPDICPTSLQTMKEVVLDLESRSIKAPQVIFITVDPERDTPEVMKKYVAYFDDRFIGITGDEVGITELTQSIGVVFSRRDNPENPSRYSVDHSASMFLVDAEGEVRARIKPPHDVQNIVSDYLTIADGAT